MKNQSRTAHRFAPHCLLGFSLACLLATGAAATAADTAAQRAQALLKQMTLEEKIGQMTQVDADALKGRGADVQKYFLGSVLSGGSSDPADNNPRTWLKSVREFRVGP